LELRQLPLRTATRADFLLAFRCRIFSETDRDEPNCEQSAPVRFSAIPYALGCPFTEWISAKALADKPALVIAISAKTIAIKSGHLIALYQQKQMAIGDIRSCVTLAACRG